MSKHRADVEVTGTLDSEFKEALRAFMHDEFAHFLSDIEFRVKQAYDVERRYQPDPNAAPVQVGDGKVYAEDLHLTSHMLTGYTVTANTPAAGSISWASVHMVYNGTDYLITDGNTANKYVWWDPAISNTVLQTGNTKPDIKGQMALVFVNNGGTPYEAINASVAPAVANNAVDSNAIIAGAVGTTALATDAVTTDKIGANAVTSTEIAGSAVGSTQLASSAVTAGKIATGAINSSGLFTTGVVGSTAIATDAVTNDKIATGAVGSGEIASSAVGSTQLATGAVTTAKIAGGAVTSTEIATGAVGATQIGASAITAPKLNIVQHILY